MKLTTVPIQQRGQIRLMLCVALMSVFAGCTHETVAPSAAAEPAIAVESTPQDFLINLLNELDAIAEWTGPGTTLPGNTGTLLGKADAESVYVYGELTLEGYGAVVTERHAYPKGMLLITVRKTYGMPQGHIASEVKRYTSAEALRRGEAQQTSQTEVYGTSRDTIVTRVLSNGISETYTFRLPVITATVAASAELSRTRIRFGQGGEVVVETRDGLGRLIQTQRSRGEADGTLLTRTEYPDGSWREARSVGRGDGTIYRENRTSP
jgi:hypothetical protein